MSSVRIALLSTADGVLMLNWGSVLDTEWESQAHIDAIDKGPEFQEFLELIKTSVNGPPKIYTIDFDHPADATLNAPITEFCIAKVKDAAKGAELLELLQTLGKQLTAGPGCYGPAAAGTTKQEEGTDIILIGWDTVQVSIHIPSSREAAKDMRCRHMSTLWRAIRASRNS